MGAHLRVLSDSFPMNPNMTGFKYFSKIFASMCFGGGGGEGGVIEKQLETVGYKR